MSDRTISQFFQQCSVQYLIANLEPGLQGERYSAEALMAFARKSIISRRRGTDLDFDSLDTGGIDTSFESVHIRSR
ncbi:hypothetical protein H0A66_16945 [Alcaligenaceae bacterium]|nr:hypothetical protein [Alcaligenaceae bacterium]